MNVPRYSPSVAVTLAEALTRPGEHAWCLTDADTGTVKGVYAAEAIAVRAMMRLAGTGGLYVMTVVHPARCACPEVAA